MSGNSISDYLRFCPPLDFYGRPEKDIIQLPESDFSRKFTVSGTETEFTKKSLDQTVSGAIMRLGEFGDPVVNINSSAVRVEIGKDLSSPRKEATLRQFLADAETIIEKAAQYGAKLY